MTPSPTPPPDDPRPTGELTARLRGQKSCYLSDLRDAADRLDALEAENAKLMMERDRLIGEWPFCITGCVYQLRDGQWSNTYDPFCYPTKAAAVRAKAGLGEEGGEAT